MSSLPVDLPPLLAMETSTAVCAVGAVVQGVTFEDTRYLERAHNQQALGMIEAVTQSVRHRFGSKFAGFELVAFGRGPGSFTGVRIGAALAQGVAYAGGAQVLALSSLQVQADALLEHPLAGSPSSLPDDCVVLVKSRQQLFYAQAFSRRPVAGSSQLLAPSPSVSPWRNLSEPSLVSDHGEWQRWLASTKLDAVGGAPGAKPVALLGQLPDWLQQSPLAAQFTPDVAVTAAALLRVATAEAMRGNGVAPHLGLPEYLSADSPWQPSA